jgi:hypothetical protein
LFFVYFCLLWFVSSVILNHSTYAILFFRMLFFEKKIGKYIERGTQFNLRVFLFEENFFFFFYEKTARGKFVRNCCNFFCKGSIQNDIFLLQHQGSIDEDTFMERIYFCNTMDQSKKSFFLLYGSFKLICASSGFSIYWDCLGKLQGIDTNQLFCFERSKL